jgi:hypothetical protein
MISALLAAIARFKIARIVYTRELEAVFDFALAAGEPDSKHGPTKLKQEEQRPPGQGHRSGSIPNRYYTAKLAMRLSVEEPKSPAEWCTCG